MGAMKLEVLRFTDRGAFRRWLEENHTRRESVWLEFFKGPTAAFKHTEALEEALCFGWIDSLIRRVDERIYRVKFSNRRESSRWSERNKRIVAELIRDGRMVPPGLKKVNAARESGEWDRQPAKIHPEQVELLAGILKRFPAAYEKFNRASPSARKLFAGYYFSAKKEQTRERRLMRIVSSLETSQPIM